MRVFAASTAALARWMALVGTGGVATVLRVSEVFGSSLPLQDSITVRISITARFLTNRPLPVMGLSGQGVYTAIPGPPQSDGSRRSPQSLLRSGSVCLLLRDHQGRAQTGGTMEKQVLQGCFRGFLAATLLLVTHPRALSPDSMEYYAGEQGTFSCLPYLALSLGASAFLDSPVHNHFQDTRASWTGFASVFDLAGEKSVSKPFVFSLIPLFQDEQG